MVGAGSYIQVIARPTKVSYRLLANILIGLLLIILGSVFNLFLTVSHALGSRFSYAFLWEYVTSTQHGKVTFIRLGLALLLVPLSIITKWRNIVATIFVLVSIAFLATFSILSHATTMKGIFAFIADLIHISSATLWVGAIVFSILCRVWLLAEFVQIIKRVSSVSFISVILLVITGIYTSLIHIQRFDALFNTIYGQILLFKVGIFIIVLILAALNRWYFMPHLLDKQNSFRRMLITETCLLIAVLIMTGILTISPVPHQM
jgi:copper transport protein